MSKTAASNRKSGSTSNQVTHSVNWWICWPSSAIKASSSSSATAAIRLISFCFAIKEEQRTWLTSSLVDNYLISFFFFYFGFNILRLISFRYPGKVWVECPSSTVGSHGGPVAGFGWARPRRSTGHGVDGFYRWGNEHNSVRTRRQFSRFPLLSRLSRRMDQREQGTTAADGQL